MGKSPVLVTRPVNAFGMGGPRICGAAAWLTGWRVSGMIRGDGNEKGANVSQAIPHEWQLEGVVCGARRLLTRPGFQRVAGCLPRGRPQRRRR